MVRGAHGIYKSVRLGDPFCLAQPIITMKVERKFLREIPEQNTPFRVQFSDREASLFKYDQAQPSELWIGAEFFWDFAKQLASLLPSLVLNYPVGQQTPSPQVPRVSPNRKGHLLTCFLLFPLLTANPRQSALRRR